MDLSVCSNDKNADVLHLLELKEDKNGITPSWQKDSAEPLSPNYATSFNFDYDLDLVGNWMYSISSCIPYQ